jgi:hypothetical protein
MIQVSLVPPALVNQIWPQVEEYLKGAADYTHGRYEVEDIRTTITDRDHHLWIAFDGAKIKGAVVTSYIKYPRKKALCMTFCGGVDLDEWKSPMLKLLQAWAFDGKCDCIESTARFGWAKVFNTDGYKPLWQAFELPAGMAGLGEQHE